jgi:glycerol-3-phosphate acyltransferase PlsY
LLDYLKGAMPVAAALFNFNLSGWPLALAACAPVLGHAFSPFLRFRGGKGLTVTFGVWSGLTLAQAPLVLGLFMILFYFTVSVEAWAVVLSLIGLFAHLLIQQADGALLLAWFGNLAIVVWKHRRELRQTPRLKPLFSGKPRA